MNPPPDAGTLASWGLDPAWSRTIEVPSHDGGHHAWHVLDTGPPADPIRSAGDAATVLCVHGNPTWAYSWATFLQRLGDRHRVIAVDQLGMGYSERVGLRRYAQRVADLGDVIDALDLDEESPLVVAAHDWGGAVAMGWAVAHTDRLAGLVLCNTGIAVPSGRSAPGIIRLAASGPLRDLVCRRTSAFVEGTVRLSGSRLSATEREAFRAPYRRAADRTAIADFVGDIPLRSPHPSEHALSEVADRLSEVTAPVLLAWGAKDPVFDDDFAQDLAGRFPDAVVQRYPKANHLVMAEADVAGAVDVWLDDLVAARSAGGLSAPADPSVEQPQIHPEPLWAGFARRAVADGDAVAFSDVAAGEQVTFSEFTEMVDRIALELRRRGLQSGERVAMLTPPSVGLVAAVYAVWRAGGVTVVADRGLGLRGLGAAIASTRPDWVIGPRSARLASRALRWAPRATAIDIDDLVRPTDPFAPSRDATELGVPDPSQPAAILFTSGATGPAKGVRYTHRQLGFQREALRRTYSIVDDDRLVAAFAPFALYGPALGITTALPDCDVTAPGSLSAERLADACASIDATMVFASPAALANVVDTAPLASRGTESVRRLRLVMSAGAPVPSETLRAVADLAPSAALHTPYGMTEVLPVADVTLEQIAAAEIDEPGGGVCVGIPVDGVEVRLVALDFDATAGVPDGLAVGSTGELLVRCPWVSDGYLGLWATQRHARPGEGWHRTGDVGHVDSSGRLWVEGRAVHVIRTADRVVTSVSVERLVERAGIDGVAPGRVAAVGVGPDGTQQVVVVLGSGGGDAGPLADSSTTAAVRAAVDVPIAAVLTVSELPVDIRHNAKIDRAAVAAWADDVLAGRRAKAPTRR